jgi:hypothetical protein
MRGATPAEAIATFKLMQMVNVYPPRPLGAS